MAVIVGLECVGLPLPGETALLAAAVYAGTKHDLNIVSVILTAAAAAIVGRMIGYVIGREYGYWLLLRYGNYVRMTQSRIKLGQYLVLAPRRQDRLHRSVYTGAAHLRRDFCRRQCHAVAQLPGDQRGRLVLVGGGLRLCRLCAGREFEQLEGPLVIVLAIITVVLFIAGGIFIHRHEAQLAAEAERAMPGPLQTALKAALPAPNAAS